MNIQFTEFINIPTVVLGASLLMFGWFGFNAGSALAADGLAAHAFMTTGVSAAAAMLSWMLCDIIKNKKPTLIGASTGMVAGLVGITPGAGFVPMWAAVIIGLTTSPVCYIMISYGKKKSALTMRLMHSAVTVQAMSGADFSQVCSHARQSTAVQVTVLYTVSLHSSVLRRQVSASQL